MFAKENEIQIIRTYNAPLRLVWDAWANIEEIEKWWGPRGFTITTKTKDLRAGGKWIYTMHGPDGVDYPNHTIYHEVIEYKKLVYDHGGNEHQENLFTVTALFSEQNDQTTINIVFTLPNAEQAMTIKKHIKMANGYSTWDRLGEYLEKKISDKDIFMITHSVNTSIENLFSLWTDANTFLKWLGPHGVNMSFTKDNIAERETSLWSMTMPDGQIKYGALNYKKIQAPNFLMYTQNFSDEYGHLSKHPFCPNYPDILLTTITFFPEGPQSSRCSVVWQIEGHATPLERKTFHDMKDLMNKGWNESFEKLDSLIK